MEDIDWCNKTSIDKIESSRLDISKFWSISYPDNLTKIDFIIFTKDEIDR